MHPTPRHEVSHESRMGRAGDAGHYALHMMQEENTVWTSIELPALGTLPKKKEANPREFLIPSEIPYSAKEVLIYVWYSSGEIAHDSQADYRIFVKIGASGKAVAFFLVRVHTYPQVAYSTNSDNVWLPMPKDRTLRVEYQGTIDFSDAISFYSEVKILAYR
jgi:hypothetical protein